MEPFSSFQRKVFSATFSLFSDLLLPAGGTGGRDIVPLGRLPFPGSATGSKVSIEECSINRYESIPVTNKADIEILKSQFNMIFSVIDTFKMTGRKFASQ